MSCNYEEPPGIENNNYSLPAGYTIRTQLELNQSTTVQLFDRAGNMTVNWNSGTFLSCFVLGAGVGLAVSSYSGNPKLGMLAGGLVSAGCQRAVSYSSEDGDENC